MITPDPGVHSRPQELIRLEFLFLADHSLGALLDGAEQLHLAAGLLGQEAEGGEGDLATVKDGAHEDVPAPPGQQPLHSKSVI